MNNRQSGKQIQIEIERILHYMPRRGFIDYTKYNAETKWDWSTKKSGSAKRNIDGGDARAEAEIVS